MTRGATVQFGGSPWARAAMWQDQDRTTELGRRARELEASVSVAGKTPNGPWHVRVMRGSRVLVFRGYDVHDVVAFGLDRWAAGADDRGIAWRAGPDALGHAHPTRGRVIWTLCRQRAVDERATHPERSRCQACWRALDRDVRSAAGAVA